MRSSAFVVLAVTVSVCGACREEQDSGMFLTRQELLDPESCKGCHEQHYREWKSSMHAYAADDPVFVAMNERGQEETQGELGSFCVNCHAPMAVREGLTWDGLNMDEVPSHLKGVTCYFCHSVAGVGEPKHNNPLELPPGNTTMFGPYADPAPSAPHRAAYSVFFDRERPESSDACGACHDVVNQRGVHLERTYAEWQGSLFATDRGFVSCAGCHMPTRAGRAVSGPLAPRQTPFRDVATSGVHEHLWPGLDTALMPFPVGEPELMEVQRRAVQYQLEDTAQIVMLSVSPGDGPGSIVTLLLESIMPGHAFPSGAAQDRRAWVELTAMKDGEVIFTSGHVGDDEAVVDVEARHPEQQMLVLRDEIFTSEGAPAHMFWDAAPSEAIPTGYRSHLLPGPPPSVERHYISWDYRLPGVPDRIMAVLKVRAVGLDVLRDLYRTGHLRPEDHDSMPTFALEGTRIEWNAPSTGPAFGDYPSPPVAGTFTSPCHYRALLGEACEDP